jgi:hypothetical protein
MGYRPGQVDLSRSPALQLILVHSLPPKLSQASLLSVPGCLGNEMPTQVVHSKVLKLERTMCRMPSPAEFHMGHFMGPAQVNPIPLMCWVSPLLSVISPPTAAGAEA